jgi:hypothetical protein
MEKYSDFLEFITEIQKDAEKFSKEIVNIDLRKIEGRKASYFVTCWGLTFPVCIEWQYKGMARFMIPEDFQIKWPNENLTEFEFAQEFLRQVEKVAGKEYVNKYLYY